MENVKLTNLSSYQGQYLFEIDLAGKSHKIRLSRDYWLKMTDASQPPAQLVLDSVMFLLSREPKEKILPEFDLADIKNYFPDYEEFIKNKK